MNKRMNIQGIKNKNGVEWAILPGGFNTDIADFKRALRDQQEELIPDKYAKRLISGENPIRVWREYRQLTQQELAKAAKISVSTLSQLENNERAPSITVLKKLAQTLKLSLEDLTDSH